MKWRRIFEGIYEVSERGDVRRAKKGRGARVGHILKNRVNNRGYAYVDLHFEGSPHRFLVHRLVAGVFLDYVAPFREVNHKDGNPLNNHYTNLEYVTHKENASHAYDMGFLAVGTRHPSAKLTENKVRYTRLLYSEGVSQSTLSKIFDVNQSQISRAINGITWRHVE